MAQLRWKEVSSEIAKKKNIEVLKEVVRNEDNLFVHLYEKINFPVVRIKY